MPSIGRWRWRCGARMPDEWRVSNNIGEVTMKTMILAAGVVVVIVGGVLWVNNRGDECRGAFIKEVNEVEERLRAMQAASGTKSELCATVRSNIAFIEGTEARVGEVCAKLIEDATSGTLENLREGEGRACG